MELMGFAFSPSGVIKLKSMKCDEEGNHPTFVFSCGNTGMIFLESIVSENKLK